MPYEHDANFMETKSTPMHLYEYAVVRFVPDIEREEFVNIGLVMMCKRRRWLCVRFSIDEERIKALHPDVDIQSLKSQIKGFERVSCADTANGGSIATLEAHERFRWLTAVRSAGIQTSRPHCGLTPDLDNTFNQLFSRLVSQ